MRSLKEKLEALSKNISNSILSLKKIFQVKKRSETEFFQAVEVLGRLIIRHIEQGNLITAKANLEFLFEKFLHLATKETSPNKFNGPMFGATITDVGFNQEIDELGAIISHSQKQNEETSISIRLIDHYLSVIQRAWSTSVSKKEYKFSRIVLYHMSLFVQRLCEEAESRDKILQLLYGRYQLLFESFDLDNDAERLSQTSVISYGWYFDSVFNKNFKLEYLSDINSQLIYLIKANIDSYNEKIILGFIEEIVHKDFVEARVLPTSWPKDPKATIIISDLQYRSSLIANESALVLFKSEITKQVSLLNPTIGQDVKDKVEISLVNRVNYNFKRWNLRFNLVAVYAFLIYCKKDNVVKEALLYNQPPDARATWTNEEPLPTDKVELALLISSREIIQSLSERIWPGHHGSQIYISDAILACICNAIRLSPIKNYSELDFVDGRFNINSQGGLLYNLKELLKEYEEHRQVPKFATDINSWGSIKGLLNKSISVLEDSIIFKKRTATIDPEKTLQLKKQIVESIENAAIFRRIYAALNKIDYGRHSPEEGATQIRVKRILPKEPLTSELSSIYYGYAESVVSEFTWYEDVSIIRTLVAKTTKVNYSKSSFDAILNGLKTVEDYLLVCINLDPFSDLFFSSDYFKSLWSTDGLQSAPFKNAGQVGTYREKLPVLSFYDRSNKKTVLLLKKSEIGILCIYKQERDSQIEDGENYIFRIESFSANNDLKSMYLQNQPRWLVEQTNPEEFLDLSIEMFLAEKIQILGLENIVGWFFTL